MSKKKKTRIKSKFTQKRLVITYAILRTLITPFFKFIYRFSYEKNLKKIKGPYLLLVNHNMQLDPVLVGIAFKRHMFFVSSDHVMREGLLSKLFIYAIAPIARVKGKTDAFTVIQMIHSLKAGNNVCMFAEGNRSFDGVTGNIPDVTAKVIKKAGVKVITYKIDGGYFTDPRWGFSIRKGKTTGKIVNIYEPEKINELSIEDLNKKIKDDLFVDAYKHQEKEAIKFKGRNRALGMETAMFMCPKCKKIGTLQSKGNDIICDCGFNAHYREDGFLENMPEKMDTLTKWNIFQKAELKNKVLKKLEKKVEPLFSDTNVEFYRIGKARGKYNKKTGNIVAYADYLECCGEKMQIKQIPSYSIYARNSLTFMYNNEHCELKGEKMFSALKYKYLFEIVNE